MVLSWNTEFWFCLENKEFVFLSWKYRFCGFCLLEIQSLLFCLGNTEFVVLSWKYRACGFVLEIQSLWFCLGNIEFVVLIENTVFVVLSQIQTLVYDILPRAGKRCSECVSVYACQRSE